MNGDADDTFAKRAHPPGNAREWTVASLASLAGASTLVWTLSSAWVGFRDGVVVELAACAHGIELLDRKVEQYRKEGDPWIDRIKNLESERERNAERLQIALDRIRDLELSKRP